MVSLRHATNRQLQIAARHVGLGGRSSVMLEAVEAKRLTSDNRKILIVGLESLGYLNLDTSNPDHIKPVKTVLKKPKKTKYTTEQLQLAFMKVASNKDWKDKICKVIDMPSPADEELLTQAIITFTGSIPEYTRLCGNKVKVKAVGYYASIG
jgi:hypothetical protein